MTTVDRAQPRAPRPGVADARSGSDARPTTPTGAVGSLPFAELQHLAGNRAVSQLVAARRSRGAMVQRFPTASADAQAGAGEDVVRANLAIAERDAAAPGFLEAQLASARAGAGTTRNADPALTPAVLIEGVWRLPAASSGVPTALRARYLALRQLLVRRLNQLYAPLSSARAVSAFIDDPTHQASLQSIVDGLHAGSASFDVFETAADLWEHWLRLPTAESMGQEGAGSEQRRPLRAALDSLVERWADTFSGQAHGRHARPATVTPEADPAPADIAAVVAAIRGRQAWVGPGDMDTVAAGVAGSLGRPVAEVRTALPRWLIHAEIALIREAGLAPPSPAIWAYARSVYVATMDLPIWRYFDEHIVQFDLFGRRIWGKRAGVHRDVLPTLRLVEQEALRLGGAQTLAALNFEPGEWGGFRFEPQNADLTSKRHVSFHATGLAIDFRVRTNNVIQGPATNLLDAIATQGGSAFTTASIASGDTPTSRAQTSWANEVQEHLRRRDDLRHQVEALAGPGSPATAATGTATAPAATGSSATPTGTDATPATAGTTAEPSTTTTEGGAGAQSSSTPGTASATPATAARDAELARLRAQLVVEEQWLAAVGSQGTATTLRTSGETIRTHLEAVESAFRSSFMQHFGARPPAPEHETAADRNARQAARRAALIAGWPPMRDDIRAALSPQALAAFDRQFPATPAPIAILQTLDPFLDYGITDQPPWMVQAFTSLGWRWGGGWHDPVDAMHFDFMGTVPGVRN